MAIDADRMQKPVRKLRKLLKKMGSQPAVEDVHDLRTSSRRLEASFQASLDTERNSRKVLKKVRKIRKAAGKVRDMDVLTGYLSGVHPPDNERACMVQLLEHLGAQRARHAKKLVAKRRQYGSSLRKQLQRISRDMDHALPQDGNGRSDGNSIDAQAAASALRLISELRQPARLGKNNLHPYRLKVKELRNVLEMAQNAKQQEFVDTLGKVKDAIGEWHDWEELATIAQGILDHGRNCQLLQELRRTSKSKYQDALSLAEMMRKKFLRISHGNRKGSHRGVELPAESVWSATAALAA